MFTGPNPYRKAELIDANVLRLTGTSAGITAGSSEQAVYGHGPPKRASAYCAKGRLATTTLWMFHAFVGSVIPDHRPEMLLSGE